MTADTRELTAEDDRAANLVQALFDIASYSDNAEDSVEAAIPAALAALRKAVEEERETLRAALQKPYLTVFIDGRNEHGSHVLFTAGDNIGDTSIINEMTEALEDQSIGYAESVITAAEALGYKINHCVVTTWNRTGESVEDYWELEGVDSVLSALLCGTPEQQEADFARARGKGGQHGE
jgi:hypothetical protein